MKYIIGLLLVLVCTQVQSQSIGRFRYDSTIIEKVGGTNELVIRNKTKDTLGFLYNNGGGVTSFRRAKQINDTTIVIGIDTMLIKSSASGGSGLNTLNGLNAGLQTLAIGTAGTAPNWVSATSTHTLNIPSALTAAVTAGLVPYTRTQIWDAKIGPGDTAAMLANYLNSGDTVSLSNRINLIKASGITALIADVVTSAPDPQGVAIAQLSNTGVIAGTYTNPTITVDSKGRILTIANGSGGGGSGTDNVNGGAGYRWVIGGQVVRSVVASNGILIDSTSNTNALTFKVDTSVIATLNDVAAVAAANTGITALTGDVTATGPGSSVATVANDAITFAKFQNITSSRLLGRYTVGSGDMQEISLGSGLAITGGVLDVVGGGTTYSFTAPLSETGGVVSIANSLADGSTKGAASFTAADFNSSAGNISLDYTNGQAASAGTKGFLTSTDWATFNNKISNITGLITAGTNTTITGSGTAGSPYVINANSSGTVNTGFANTLAYYAVTGTVVDDLPAITASRALVSDANGLPVASATTSTELGYVAGVTSNIQTQINAKQATIGLGSTSQYFRGDLSLATFPTNVSTFTNDAAYLTNVTGKITAGTNISITGSGTAGSPYVVSSTATGLSDGDKGDITVSSTGTVWNIDALAVGNAEINDVAWAKITGVPTDFVTLAGTQTLTNKTLTSPVINVTADATGDVYYRSAGGLFTRLGIGSDGQVLKVVSGLPAWAADATSGGGGATLSDGDYGDVTVSGTGTAITVDAGAITNSKLANVATNIFKGRITAGTGAVEDLTVTQATSMLNTFTSTLKGLAPASGGGTTTFLRADGTWAAPASGYSFEPNDFDGTTTISIDYTNGQKASTSLPGFLTAANWNTFNNKQNAITTGTTAQYFRGDLSLATFPTAVSAFTNDAGYLTNITGKVTAGTAISITGLGTTASPYVINGTAGTTYSAGYGLTLAGTTFTVDTATIFTPYQAAINARVKYSDTSTMLTAYRNALNTKLGNITGYITAGANITITGSGTAVSPYSIAAAGTSGVADGDKGDITVTSSGTVWNIDAGAVGNTEIAGGVDAAKIADGSVSSAEYQFINSLTSNAQTQLNGKQATITTGTTAQYFRGDLSLATFPTALSSFTNDPGFITNITGKLNAGTNVTVTGAGTTASPYVISATGGGATLTGTANRITIASDVVDIASTYVGQTSITTLGTVATGTWNATAIATTKGGVPAGGTVGQILAKINGTSYNTQWIPAPTFSVFGGYGISIDGENNIFIDTATISAKYVLRGAVTAGSNITITGSGTGASPYVIASSATGLADGDKGDVTVSSTGTVFTIDNGTVTNTKMANMVASTFKGRVTGSTGAPEDMTATQATSLLNTFSSTLKGLVPLSGGGTTNFLRADGTFAAPPTIADGDKGDITVASSGAAFTVDAAAITDTKIGTAIAATHLGDGTVSTAEFQFINTLSSNAQTQLDGKEPALAASTGIRKASATLFNTLAEGASGGQTVKGGTGVADLLKLQATTGVGNTSSAVQILGGNNGASELARFKTHEIDMYYNNGSTATQAFGLIQQKVGIGHGFTFAEGWTDLSFGGQPVLIGYQTQGSGTAAGYKAKALNPEAVALGPQAYADGLATIAIGDGARAESTVWEGNGTIPAGNYGNQFVVGDAAYVRGNINYFVGQGGGIDDNFGACLGCVGSTTSYTYSFTNADHQFILGGYDWTSDYFNGGQGLFNDFYFGPINSGYPHHITMQITNSVGTNYNGVNWTFNPSLGAGTGNSGPFIFNSGVPTSSGTTQHTLEERLRINYSGVKISGLTTGSGGDSLLVVNNGLLKMVASGGGGTALWNEVTTGIIATANQARAGTAGADFQTWEQLTGAVASGAVGISAHSGSTIGYVYNNGTNQVTLDGYDYGGLVPLNVRIGGNGGNLILGGNGGNITFNASTSSYTFPTGRPAANGYVLTGNTDGSMTWAAASGGGGSQTLQQTTDLGTTSTNNIQIGASGTNIQTWERVTAMSADGTATGIGVHAGSKNFYLYNDGTNPAALDAYDYGTSSPLPIRVGGNGGTVQLGGNGGAVTINNGSNTIVLPTTRPGTNGYAPTFNTDGSFNSWAATSGGGGGFTDPLTTNGDIITRISGSTTRLAAGTAAYVLTSNGAGNNISWQPVPSPGGVAASVFTANTSGSASGDMTGSMDVVNGEAGYFVVHMTIATSDNSSSYVRETRVPFKRASGVLTFSLEYEVFVSGMGSYPHTSLYTLTNNSGNLKITYTTNGGSLTWNAVVYKYSSVPSF